MSNLPYILYMALLAFTPVAFGTVSDWSQGLMVVFSLMAFTLYLKQLQKGDKSFYLPPGLLPLCVWLAYMLIQLIPLPPALVKYLSPASFHLYQQTVGVVEPEKWFPISVNIKSTLLEFFRYVSYLAFYILTVQFLSNKETFKKILQTIIYFIGLFSLVSVFYWLIIVRFPNPLTGPYVNRNHYAGLMEMTLPLMLATFLYYRPTFVYQSWRDILLETFTIRKKNTYFFSGAAFVISCLSLFFTFSRGGIISFCAAMIFFFAMIPGRKFTKNNKMLFSVIVVLIVFLVGSSVWGTIFDRFEKIIDMDGNMSEGRPTYWANSLNIITSSPLTGTGFGSFGTIIREHNTLPIVCPPAHAHSDHLELFVEGGIIGALIVGWFFISYFKHVIPAFRKRRDRYAILIFLAGMAGIVSIFFHSVTDFNLHIGANGLYFFFLLGLGVAAVNTRFKSNQLHTNLKPLACNDIKRIYLSSWILGMGAFVFYSCLLIAFFHMLYFINNFPDKNAPRQEIRLVSHLIDRAILFNPIDPLYRMISAELNREMDNTTAADMAFKTAIFLHPAESGSLQEYAQFLGKNGDMASAENLFKAGINNGRFNPTNYVNYADFLLSTGDRDGYIENMRQAIKLDAGLFKKQIDHLVDTFSEDTILKMLPDRVAPYQYFGDYLARKNQMDAAETVYLKSLLYIGNETDKNKPGYFLKIAHFLSRQDKYEDALLIIDKGLAYCPTDIALRLKAASYYEKLGITYRAEEEYEKVLTIDPTNKTAMKKLRVK
ncbi:MAG: O-antigen ligase family protein [Proteobacteria bacterium]|nr:O-antigen ligase family protein [Pseudomonadota bacterium]